MAEQVFDGWDAYWRNKVRSLIPAFYWNSDDGTLADIVDAVAAEVAELRRSHDRTWENQSPELADDWVLPYLGELVAARLVDTTDSRTQRVSVAKAIYYRRRAGTPALLEEVATDVSGWPTVVREAMLGLQRAPHRLDVEVPETPRLTGARRGFLAGGPFDVHPRTPEFRPARGQQGLHNLNIVRFHQAGTAVYRAEGVQPYALSDGFTFDPSGRRVQLYSPPRVAADPDDWSPATWTRLPQALDCERLNDVRYAVDAQTVQAARDASLDAAIVTGLTNRQGAVATTRAGFERVLATVADSWTPSTFEELRRAALRSSGRLDFVVGRPGETPAFSLEASGPLDAHAIEGADSLSSVPAVPPALEALVDGARGLVFAADLERTDYHYGWPGPVGAGPYVREFFSSVAANDTLTDGGALDATAMRTGGVVELRDDSTWEFAGTRDQVETLELRARVGTRPYVRLTADVVFEAKPDVDANLTLEGIWFGAEPDATRRIVLRGDFEDVIIDHATLDPGGAGGAVELVVEGNVERLYLRRCMTGVIRVEGSVEELRSLESLHWAPERLALDVSKANATDLTRTTVHGGIAARRLSLSHVLATATVSVLDAQRGCCRYSAVPEGTALHSPYRCVSVAGADVPGLFESNEFGDARFSRLSRRSPVWVREGAEDGEEIGVWGFLKERRRSKNVRTKIFEFLPMGLNPVLVRET